MSEPRIQRLTSGDREMTRGLFALLAEVFEEPHGSLSDAYLDGLLASSDFWAMVAVVDEKIVGGLTAHTLPMSRSESSEVFIYDVAVHPDHQRKGVGRALIESLLKAAAEAGVQTVFVPAEDEDTHAIEFYRAVGGDATRVTFFTWDHRTSIGNTLD